MGSSEVIPPFVVSPLAALKSTLAHARVTYAEGAPSSLNVGELSNVGVVRGTALPPQKKERRKLQDGDADLFIEAASNVTNHVITASKPGDGRGWSHWEDVVRVKRKGAYEISVKEIGDTWFLPERPRNSLFGRAPRVLRYDHGRQTKERQELHARGSMVFSYPPGAARAWRRLRLASDQGSG